MTVRIPKWVLAIAMVAVVAAVAFLLGRASDGPNSGGESGSGEVPRPHCSKRQAEKALLASGFDESIHAYERMQATLADSRYSPVEPPFFTDNPTDYQIAVLRCSDLDGDGGREMVVAVAAGASGHIASWAVFTPTASGSWYLAFDRVGVPVSSIEIDGGSIVARTPTYAKGDALCCPSGYKATRVAVAAGKFQLAPRAAAEERQVLASEGRVLRLGDFEPPVDSPVQAFGDFGTPTEILSSDREACTLAWSDLGLSIDFANFGGGEACGAEGRVAYIELSGDAAEQAGWQVEGARVGMPVDSLRKLYPGARETGAEIFLVETPTIIGADGTVAVLTAYVVEGRVAAFRAYVGAAGE